MSNICEIHKKNIETGLKQQNLKVTGIRLKLLDVLEHTREPLSAKQIFKKIGSANSDLVTVYRNLEILKNNGLVTELSFKKNEAFYEIASSKHHHHIVCESCGKVKDLPSLHDSDLEKKAQKFSGFAKISHHSLEFFGLCRACFKP